jgi:hypothetical protein
VLWYVANLADAHGFTLSEVAVTNITKLWARYPSGFTVAAAAAKADESGPDATLAAYATTFDLPPVDANGSPVVDEHWLCPICDLNPCKCEELGYFPGGF